MTIDTAIDVVVTTGALCLVVGMVIGAALCHGPRRVPAFARDVRPPGGWRCPPPTGADPPFKGRPMLPQGGSGTAPPKGKIIPPQGGSGTAKPAKRPGDQCPTVVYGLSGRYGAVVEIDGHTIEAWFQTHAELMDFLNSPVKRAV